MSSQRTFVLVANRADSSGEAPLDDLAGAGGRFDLVTRFVTASLLTSHGIREDATAIVLFTRGEEAVALRIRGADAVGIRPDERNTAARLNEALLAVPMPVWQPIVEGIELKAVDLEGLLGELPGPIALMAEDGRPVDETDLEARAFVLGDQDDLTDAQRKRVEQHADARLSVGQVALQADQVVTVVQNTLDRR